MASSKKTQRQTGSATPPAASLTPPTQQVWLAGLGALAKAQEQGSKAIEALLNDGLAFQRKSQAEAQQRLQEATERLSQMAGSLGQSASLRVDKLEHLFEDRVAKALHSLGMPSLVDMQMLSARVAHLESQLQALQPGPSSAAKPKAAAPTQAAVSRARQATPTPSRPARKKSV
jgi:poly(hydroxyalkanoate) granule-associated protein